MLKKLFTILFFLTVVGTADATTYYVQSNGSNSNDCTAAQSTSTPKLTITNVIQNCGLTGGDTIEVRAASPGGGVSLTARRG